MSTRSRQHARVGSIVPIDGQAYQLWSLAAPSGWWALRVGGTGNAVRVRRRRGSDNWEIIRD